MSIVLPTRSARVHQLDHLRILSSQQELRAMAHGLRDTVLLWSRD
jgi:hypothetical protein